MGQFLKMCGLASAGALLVAARRSLPAMSPVRVSPVMAVSASSARAPSPRPPVLSQSSAPGQAFVRAIGPVPMPATYGPRQNFYGARGRYRL